MPLAVDAPRDAVLDAIEAVTGEYGDWRKIEVDRAAGTVTAESVTRLLRFVDDVKIWVTEEGGQVSVHAESRSRLGKADFGKNAKRLRQFFADLKANLPG